MPNNSIINNYFRKKPNEVITSSASVKHLMDFSQSSSFSCNQNNVDYCFSFDFKWNRVLIERYAIKLKAYDFYPIEWTVEASNDGKKWDVIDHPNENICQGNTGARSDGIVGCKTAMSKMREVNKAVIRYIRFKMIGSNSCRYTHAGSLYCSYCYLTGFDIFGRVYFMTQKKTPECNRMITIFIALITFKD